jgi:hypothetical protein
MGILSLLQGIFLIETKGLAFAIKEEFPEIHTVRLEPSFEEKEMSYGNEIKVILKFGVDLVHDDNYFFRIFDIDLTLGDAESSTVKSW